MADRLPTLPERRAIKAALRAAGLSDRQVRTLLTSGWAALVGEAKAEADALRDQLESLKSALGNSFK